MNGIHFGAGNIGRGFIGEVLYDNGFNVTFVDVNSEIINALSTRGTYDIGMADPTNKKIKIENVTGINNETNPELVVKAMGKADLITTAIGPNILPVIAPLIAKGIDYRQSLELTTAIDVIACENMIGGSAFLKEEVKKHVTDLDYLEQYVGFPNAAVDRIVPMQQHEDVLYVEVEPFKEWVIETPIMKNKSIILDGVLYVDDLEPFIERKLFSVNTGHATVAYTAYRLGYETIDEAMLDTLVLAQLKAVLSETGSLLIKKWGFDPVKHEAYITKIIGRFENPYISDSVNRVARTPLRKLGPEERFSRPIRELKERGMECPHLIGTLGMILTYQDDTDVESLELQKALSDSSVQYVLNNVTGLTEESLVESVTKQVAHIKNH